MKLSYKILIPVSAVLVVLGAFIYFFFERSFRETVYREEFFRVEETLRKHAGEIRGAFASSTSAESQEKLERFSGKISSSGTLLLSIWDADRRVLWSTHLESIGSRQGYERLNRIFDERAPYYAVNHSDDSDHAALFGEFLEMQFPIMEDGVLVGVVQMHQMNEAILGPFGDQLRLLSIIVAGSMLLILLLVYAVIRYFILRPVLLLEASAQAISEGNLDRETRYGAKDEMGTLAAYFDQMRLKIRDLVRTLKKEMASVEEEVITRTRELREEQARFVASVNSLPIGFVLVDTGHATILNNPKIHEILAVPGEKIACSAIDAALGDALKFGEYIKRSTMERRLIEARDINVGGKFLHFFFAPVFSVRNDDSSDILGTAVLVEDVTEAKVVEQGKSEFFSTASHELKNPLEVIRENSEAVITAYKDTPGNDDAKAKLDGIHKESIRLLGVIHDFLEVMSLEQGKTVIAKETFDVGEAVERVVKALSYSAAEKGISLSFNASPGQLMAKGDKSKTEEVLSNLIGNALRFTSAGGVVVNAETLEGMVRVKVTDTGPGIPDSSRMFLFRKFQPAGENLPRDAKRTGLGLYISKLLTDRMQGYIGLERSEPGKGSTFFFALPSAQEAPAPVSVPAPEPTPLS